MPRCGRLLHWKLVSFTSYTMNDFPWQILVWHCVLHSSKPKCACGCTTSPSSSSPFATCEWRCPMRLHMYAQPAVIECVSVVYLRRPLCNSSQMTCVPYLADIVRKIYGWCMWCYFEQHTLPRHTVHFDYNSHHRWLPRCILPFITSHWMMIIVITTLHHSCVALRLK